MLFNSFPFVLFAVCFYSLWPLVRRTRARYLFLVTLSLFFYCWETWWFGLVLLATALLDYGMGNAMVRRPERKKVWLLLSLAGNLSTLATFKYLAFATRNVDGLLHLLGLHVTLPVVQLVLPVGLSFYTFQSLSYTIDIYRGKLKPAAGPLHFLTSITLFPHLVAGPIVRAADMLPQFLRADGPSPKQKWDGLQLIAGGLFKKTVLADNMAPFVNTAFASRVPPASGAYWWVVTVMFAAQIYCDFSGYTDIARGLAKWMGYEFSLNFNHPYSSASFREFWQRWHISLSTWFRDYVYIPLGGSRTGEAAAYRNLWITMLLSGFWHGAAWTFVIWGALHACYLSVERLTSWPDRLRRLPGGNLLNRLIVFALVCVAWVFFRAASLPQAVMLLHWMLNPMAFHPGVLKQVLPFPTVVLAYAMARELIQSSQLGDRLQQNLRWQAIGQPVTTALMLASCVYLRGPGSAFIYFQF